MVQNNVALHRFTIFTAFILAYRTPVVEHTLAASVNSHFLFIKVLLLLPHSGVFLAFSFCFATVIIIINLHFNGTPIILTSHLDFVFFQSTQARTQNLPKLVGFWANSAVGRRNIHLTILKRYKNMTKVGLQPQSPPPRSGPVIT